MGAHEITKGLEVWTLQTLLNVSILLGVFSVGLVLVQGYLDSLRRKLTLRVSLELWDVVVTLLTDLLLAVVVLIGFLVLNPDIMADIKIAVPFIPVGTALFAASLVVRLFYRGHEVGGFRFKIALGLMLSAAIVQIVGFSFVMEAPSGEYLAIHPSPFWEFVKTHLRSNAAPHGLELAQVTFSVMFPLMMIIFGWGGIRAFRQLAGRRGS